MTKRFMTKNSTTTYPVALAAKFDTK